MSWTLSVVIICVLLVAIVVWFEYRREDKSRLIWRILASIIAAVALACIALPITYNKHSNVAGDNEALLLTPGYNPDSIGTGYKLIFTTDNEIKNAYPKAKFLTGITDINAVKPAVSQLHILGYGLNLADLQQLNNIQLRYSVPSIPAGIIAVNWPQQTKTGELLQVQGKYNNTSGKTIKLLFKGLSTPLDSVNIPAGKVTNFELTTVPKITGRAAYNLIALSGKDTLEKENVPVAVEPAKPVKVLMLSASPDFETKFLKNWLSQNGYAVASRTIITKNKISQEFANIEKLPLDQLTPALFGKFDAVVGDLSTLKSLTATENAALKQQVQQNGLGVIIRADSSGKEVSWLQNSFKVSTLSTKTETTALLIQGQDSKTAPLNIDPSYINNAGNIQNLTFDIQNHVLASSALSGQGKLVFTTLRNTYNWMLAGNDKDYTRFWSLLINKAARKAATASQIPVTGIPTVDGPSILRLQSGSALSNVTVNSTSVAAMQKPSVPYEWSILYWPQNTGWQQINTNAQSPSWWYAYPKHSWQSIEDLEKESETKNYISNANNFSSVTKQIQQSIPTEVPKMYFYLLLLAACSFLWVERKLTA